MQTKTINRILYLCIALSLITISGCEETQSNKSWKTFKKALNEEEKTTPPQSLEETIDVKISELEFVVEICENNSEIKRVSSKEEPTSYYEIVALHLFWWVTLYFSVIFAHHRPGKLGQSEAGNLGSMQPLRTDSRAFLPMVCYRR